MAEQIDLIGDADVVQINVPVGFALFPLAGGGYGLAPADHVVH